jgi:hypothetical protein
LGDNGLFVIMDIEKLKCYNQLTFELSIDRLFSKKEGFKKNIGNDIKLSTKDLIVIV